MGEEREKGGRVMGVPGGFVDTISSRHCAYVHDREAIAWIIR